jgi:hypothetical protein
MMPRDARDQRNCGRRRDVINKGGIPLFILSAIRTVRLTPWNGLVEVSNASEEKSPNKSPESEEHGRSGGGLFRAAIAGPGHTLSDAFANLERAPGVERFWRHPTRNLVGARVALPAHEGAGYFDLTQINDELYVVIQNFS